MGEFVEAVQITLSNAGYDVITEAVTEATRHAMTFNFNNTEDFMYVYGC